MKGKKEGVSGVGVQAVGITVVHVKSMNGDETGET